MNQFCSTHNQIQTHSRQHTRERKKIVLTGTMSAQTFLLDLSIDPNRIGDSVAQKDTAKLLEKGLLEYFPQAKLVFETSTSDGHLCVFSQNDTIYVHARFFNHGIITINIEFFKDDSDQALVSFDVSTHSINHLTFEPASYFQFVFFFPCVRERHTNSLSDKWRALLFVRICSLFFTWNGCNCILKEAYELAFKFFPLWRFSKFYSLTTT